MIVATFGPTTAWAGKTITYDDGQFALEGHGAITAADATEYDRQGHLQWAYEGLRDWAYGLAGQPVPAPATPSRAAAATVAAAAAAAEPPGVEPPATELPAAEPPATEPPAVEAPPAAVPPSAAVPPPATEAPPVAAQPAAQAAPAAASPAAQAAPAAAPPAAAPPSASSRRWVVPVVFGVALVLLLVVAMILTGGRIRDALGIVFTVLAVEFIALLIWTAVKPAAASRAIGGIAPKALLAASGGLCAACLVLAGVLWWMPHYEVIPPGDVRVALDDDPEMKVKVINRGLLGGTYSVGFSVDGVEQQKLDVPLGAGDSRELTLALPSSVERGGVVISLGGTNIEAKAVNPPLFVVAPLELEPAIAKLDDSVTLTSAVENTGDLGGTFDGVLSVDGNEMLKQPVKVAAGATEAVTYTFDADRSGEFRLQLGDASADYAIVKPVRLKNGEVIERIAKGGKASLTVKNKTGADAVMVLARSGNVKRAVLAVYVREGKSTKITGIPDGKYVLWDCCGADWNWYMRDFYTPVEHKRWVSPLTFDTTASTRYWTTRWSDNHYNYSQKHSRTTTEWTNWTVTLGTGESKYTKMVSPSAFPRM